MVVAGFAEVMTLSSETRPVPFTVASAVYLTLLAVLVVLGGVAFFTARTVLRVS